MKKIIISGAGHGGLVAGIKLSEAGYDVTIYEKESRKSIGWNWTDDFDVKVFDEVGLPRPDESTYQLKHSWTFVSPDKGTYIPTTIPDEDKDVSIERKPLLEHLINIAEDKGVKFDFDTEVKEPLVEEEKVAGLILKSGKQILSDLVIDAAGLQSPVRMNLPEKYGIVKNWEERESFFIWRAHYERLDGPTPKRDATVYFKHLGNLGISWVVYHSETEVNVLIGQISPLDKETIEKCLNDLRDEHPLIGKKILRGGLVVEIPIRRPLGMMVGPNYAAVGDSAFMTIPMMGSGIAASMIAGNILAQNIIRTPKDQNQFSVESLWPYQVKFFEQLGASFTSIEMMKNYLLTIPEEDLNFLFKRDIIGEAELSNSATGGELSLSIVDVLKKLVKGIVKAPLLLKIKVLTDKSKKVKNLCLNIPQKYDEEAIDKWQQSINEYFR